MTDGMQKSFRLQRLAAAVIALSGAVLMVGKIVADSEPGGIPLLLMLLGAGWSITTLVRARAASQKAD